MKVSLYLHRDKDSNYETAQGLGLDEKAQDEFKYALYEVEFELEVNKDGSYKILKVTDGENVLLPVEK